MSVSGNRPPRPLDQVVVDQPDDAEGRCFELRLHGIGEHDDLSALGTPPLFLKEGRVEVFGAPITPTHRLRMVSWSAFSRRGVKLGWLMAFPFTLLNTAGYMMPPAQSGTSESPWLLRVPVVLTSLLLSVLATVWVVAIADTILDRVLPVLDRATTPYVATGSAILTVMVMLLARRSRVEGRGASALLTVHCALVLSLGITILTLHPASIEAQPLNVESTHPLALLIRALPSNVQEGTVSLLTRTFQVLRPPNKAAVEQVLSLRRDDGSIPAVGEAVCMAVAGGSIPMRREWNVFNVTVLGSLAIVALLALPLVAASCVRFARDGQGAAYAGAAIAIVGSVGALHAVLGSVRLGAEWLLSYLDGFGLLKFVGGNDDMGGYAVLSFQVPGSCQIAAEGVNSPAIFGALALGAFMLVLILLNLAGPTGAGRPAIWPKAARLRYCHRLIDSLGTPRIAYATLISAMLWPILVGLWVAYVAGAEWVFRQYDFSAAQNGVAPEWWSITSIVYWTSLALENADRLLAHVLAGTAIAYIVLNGRIPLVADAVPMVADVIAFWPPKWHPSAGASYRATLLQGIEAARRRESTKSVILVGHSQGSVIAAWYAAKWQSDVTDGPPPIRCLVTCGSPLHSLYGRFFPAVFTDEVFQAASRPGWLNFWRRTDPIATPLPHAVNTLLEDPAAPDRDPQPRGHSDYWTDATQVLALRCVAADVGSANLEQALSRQDEGANLCGCPTEPLKKELLQKIFSP